MTYINIPCRLHYNLLLDQDAATPETHGEISADLAKCKSGERRLVVVAWCAVSPHCERSKKHGGLLGAATSVLHITPYLITRAINVASTCPVPQKSLISFSYQARIISVSWGDKQRFCLEQVRVSDQRAGTCNLTGLRIDNYVSCTSSPRPAYYRLSLESYP